jgi:hypothetical protein
MAAATGLQDVIDAIRADIEALAGEAAAGATPEEVRELIDAALAAAETAGIIQFKGFVGDAQNAPAAEHLKDGYLWAKVERPGAPDFSGAEIKRWDALANGGTGAWVYATYTPSLFHLWSDVKEGYKGYYIFPIDEWNPLDFSIDPGGFATAEQGAAALSEVSYESVY